MATTRIVGCRTGFESNALCRMWHCPGDEDRLAMTYAHVKLLTCQRRLPLLTGAAQVLLYVRTAWGPLTTYCCPPLLHHPTLISLKWDLGMWSSRSFPRNTKWQAHLGTDFQLPSLWYTVLVSKGHLTLTPFSPWDLKGGTILRGQEQV
jgi:hypothetical protein